MNSIYKFRYSIAFSLLSVTCCLNADMDSTVRNLEHRVNALEYRNNSCMLNPPARPTQKCDWGVLITVEPLFLKAYENGLDFAVTTQNGPLFTAPVNPPNANSATSLQGRSKGKRINFEWDWGVRVGLGANLPHDGWDIIANWTHFFTNAHKSLVAAPNEVIEPTLLHPQSGGGSFGSKGVLQQQSGASLGAKSRWKLRLNEIDLELGRQFFVSKWLTLKPHGGFRTAWVRQTLDTDYTNMLVQPVAVVGSNESFSSSNVFMKNNYWGLGLIAGLDTQWGLSCGWSLFGNFAASILYGYFDTFHDESAIVGAPLPTVNGLGFVVGQEYNFFNYHRFYHMGRFITDFIIGLSYDTYFCDEDYHLGFDAGWEHHLFFGQNQFVVFIGDVEMGQSITNQGDLYLQGFSVKVRFDF